MAAGSAHPDRPRFGERGTPLRHRVAQRPGPPGGVRGSLPPWLLQPHLARGRPRGSQPWQAPDLDLGLPGLGKMGADVKEGRQRCRGVAGAVRKRGWPVG